MLLKYDDVISMLTVVNILAKDVNCGVNPESVVYGFCDEKQNSNIQKICFINKICNLKFAKLNFYKFCNLLIVKSFCKIIFFKVLQYKIVLNKFKNFILKYFVSTLNLYKNLLIFLKRILFYEKLLGLEYG